MEDKFGLNKYGITNFRKVFRNLTRTELTEEAAKRNEGFFTNLGAFNILTGKNTGRSPKDRFIVDQKSIHNKIDWNDINMPTTEDVFNKVFLKATAN